MEMGGGALSAPFCMRMSKKDMWRGARVRSTAMNY
jgi:hypothetical protein